MKTLKEKRIPTLNNNLTPSKDGLFFEEDVKQFTQEILKEIKEIWNKTYNFLIYSDIEDIIKQKSGFFE